MKLLFLRFKTYFIIRMSKLAFISIKAFDFLFGDNLFVQSSFLCTKLYTRRRGGGGNPYNGLYGETPPEMGYFFRLQVYDAVGILLNEVYESVGKSVISVCKNAQND